MHFKTYAPLLLALGLAGSSHAAGMSYKFPSTIGNIAPIAMPGISGVTIQPLSMPGVSISAIVAVPTLNPALYPAPTPISLPMRPAPVVGQALLPGVPSPLPLPLPIVVAELAKPLSPAPAFNDLTGMRDAVQGREPIRVNADKIFDGRRETPRATALPSDKFF